MLLISSGLRKMFSIECIVSFRVFAVPRAIQKSNHCTAHKEIHIEALFYERSQRSRIVVEEDIQLHDAVVIGGKTKQVFHRKDSEMFARCIPRFIVEVHGRRENGNKRLIAGKPQGVS